MKRQLVSFFALLLLTLATLAPGAAAVGEEPAAGPAAGEIQAAGGAGPGSPAAPSLLAASLKVVAALGVVVGIMLLLLVWVRKMGMGGMGRPQGSAIRVLDSRMIAPKKYIAVVAVGRESLVLGITDSSMSLLHRLEPGEEAFADHAPAFPQRRTGAPFWGLLEKAVARPGRPAKDGPGAKTAAATGGEAESHDSHS